MDISVVYQDPSRQEAARLANAIEDAVREATGVDVEAIDAPGVPARRALTVLRELRRARAALEGLEVRAAETAGGAGATYADLGAAVGISRQAARERWPGASTAKPGRPPGPASPGPSIRTDEDDDQLIARQARGVIGRRVAVCTREEVFNGRLAEVTEVDVEVTELSDGRVSVRVPLAAITEVVEMS